MTTPFDEFIHKLESVEYLDSDRVAVYESLFRQNFHINTEKGGPVCFSSKETKHRALNIICSDLKSENVKFVVGSLMMLSCLLSDSKGDAIDHNTLECAFDCVIHHLKGSHYDCTLLCLYTIACNSIVTLRKECTVEVYSLCSEIIISSNRRDTLIKNKDQETTHEVQTKRSNKLKCWAYRAMINTRQTSEVLTLHPLGSDLICETFQSIVVALRKRPTVLDFVGTAYTNGDTADAALLLAQLQMLVGIPVGGGLACVLENAFPACKEFSNIISFALKKATVSEDTVFRYCQVWTLWVKICTELLVPTNFSSPGAAEAETGSRINIVHAGVPLNPESAKDNFVNLLAPKNGVGVLTAPLQSILKRSRVQAALCYQRIAEALVVAKDWHEPPSVLKLLLRCLYHLLFSAVPAVPPSATKEHAAATRASCAATTVADDTDIGVSIAGVESAVKNAQTLKIAGDTLCILCASINRSHIEQVLQVSVSLGRPPSTTATPATATKALLMTSPALGASSPRALPGRAAGCEGAGGGEAQPVETAVIDKTVPSATAATAIAAATVASGSTPAAKVSALPPTAGLRASLDAIVRKLMECADLYVCDLAGDSSTAPGTHQLNQAASVLYALQNVSSGVRALATVVSASTCSTPGGTTQQRENTSHNSSAYVSYENSASVTHSAAAIAGLQVAGRSRTRSHTRVPGFSKGLFASPAKTFVRASVGAGGPGASSSSRSGAQPVETQGLLLSCEKVFTYFHKLKSALSCVVQTSDRASLLKVKNNVFATLLDLCDLSVEHDLQQLCHDWQSCTVALAQALFDELAATAVAAPLGDDHLNDTVSQAPKYQSTQLETFSLLFSAPTQASQLMYAHHQHVNISVNSYSKRSPHRSNLPSQSSQPLYMRLHPNHHPQQQQDGEFPSGSAPPMEPYASQIVLCSAHPPAVQATVDLCGIIIKVWREVWMGSEAGRRDHRARGIFIESFWWFLHRTTGFNVEANIADFESLCESVQQSQPFLSTEHCPDNMTGVVLLMTLSHACLRADTSPTLVLAPGRQQAPPPQPPQPSHPGPASPITARTGASMNIIHRALQQCMNSMTESGVLPPLFSWIPAILARLQAQSIEEQVHPSNVVHSEVPEVAAPAAGGSKSKENHPAGVISIRHAGTRAGNGDNDEEMGGGQVVNTDACVLILTSFLQRSLQQLSSMTVPTASEQHSPSLMHSMIGGLRCLLSAPLILCIGGGKGVSALLEQPSVHMNTTGYEMGANGNVNRAAVPSSSSTATATVAEPSDVHLLQAGNRVIANWRSILSLWLELKEFAVQHYSGGDFDSSQAADSDIAWIDVVLSSCAPLVHTVPFVTYPVATHAGTASVSVSVQEGLQEMYAVLWLVQAGVESSVQHRRKHAHSTLGSGLALTLLSLLVSTSVSLASMLCEGAAAIRAGAGGDSCVRNHYAAVNFSVLTKVIDAIISKYLTVFAQVHAHAMEMFGETPKYFICSTTFGASEIVFSNILKIIATVHRAATPVKGGGGGAGGGCGGSTMELIYVKRWTLSALSSMCAVNTAVNNSVRGFRTAVSRLAAGGSLRKVLREFASSLMLPGLGGGSSAVPDGEVQDIVLSAWRDLGGEEAELAGMFGTAQVPASSPITTAVSASASASGSASLANTSATVGQKRSFIPTVAPNPRVSAPTAVVEETPSKAARYEMPTTGFLKVSTPAAELAALAQKSRGGMHARQGFVPATYTGADRANLDQQSQQHSQLLSQMQSQQHSAQQPLDHSFQQQLPPAPPQVPSSGEAPQVPSQRDRAASQPAAGAPSQQSVWPDMSPPKRPTATSAVLVLQLQQQQQSHQGHVSQHSDSTTYVSPTPNAQQGPSHSQRRQHQHQHQQHYSSAPPSLPMPMDVCEEADADAVADVVAVGQSAQEQHGQSLGHPDNNRNADGNDDNTDKKPQDGTEEGESKKQETAAASGAASPAAVVAVQTEVLDVLQDIVSETCKPRNIDANYGRKQQHAGPTLMTTPPALGTVLQEAFLGINKAVEDLSVFASTASASAAPVAFSFVAASAGAGAAPTVLPVEVDSELLGAAIRQSHRLTGLLLDVLNQQQQLRASSGSASAEKDK